MALPEKKTQPRREIGYMEEAPDLLGATIRMDLQEIRHCLAADPECINQVDPYGHNAMHLCVGGGAARMKHIMQFFIDETDINLLHENNDCRCPFELALAVNDEEAVILLEEPTHRQLTAAHPDRGPELTPIT